MNSLFFYAINEHTGWVAIKNGINIDESRSKIVGNKFSIAICRPIGDKWQSKILFLAIFDPRSSIVKSVIDCRLPGVMK